MMMATSLFIDLAGNIPILTIQGGKSPSCLLDFEWPPVQASCSSLPGSRGLAGANLPSMQGKKFWRLEVAEVSLTAQVEFWDPEH